jgi:hypothetical protein
MTVGAGLDPVEGAALDQDGMWLRGRERSGGAAQHGGERSGDAVSERNGEAADRLGKM